MSPMLHLFYISKGQSSTMIKLVQVIGDIYL